MDLAQVQLIHMWFGFPLEASLLLLGAWLPTEKC